MQKFDYLIVGAGLFGSTFAHLATKLGKTCLVIDKRDHIGGNCYTYEQNNIHVHKYGPHIFHTSDEKIWKFVNSFTPFSNYSHRVKATNDGKIYSLPINLMTFHQVFGVTNVSEAQEALLNDLVTCQNPRNMEEWALANIGTKLYETLVYGYTKKQWMKEPSQLPASILRRLPIRFTWDDRYYDDTFEGIPIHGYTRLFEGLLANCKIELCVDYFANRENFNNLANKVVYTGKIDEFYEFCYGELQYRSLDFQTSVVQTNSVQGLAQMNYSSIDVPFTRMIEHKHFNLAHKQNNTTIITTELPTCWSADKIPYYPINDNVNNQLYSAYEKLAKNEKQVIFGGRLASFQYYDMHQVIAQAMKTAATFILP